MARIRGAGVGISGKPARNSHQRDWAFPLLLQVVANAVMNMGMLPPRWGFSWLLASLFSQPFLPVAQSNMLWCIYSIKPGLPLEALEEVGSGLL